MKRCSRCKSTKAASFFGKNKSRPDGLQKVCTECQREYTRNHYEQNKPVYKAKASKLNDERRVQHRALIDKLRSAPCMDCKQTFPPCAMDFDHVRGEKTNNISTIASTAFSTKRLLDELKKCEVVCACCHRIRTHNRLHAPVA